MVTYLYPVVGHVPESLVKAIVRVKKLYQNCQRITQPTLHLRALLNLNLAARQVGLPTFRIKHDICQNLEGRKPPRRPFRIEMFKIYHETILDWMDADIHLAQLCGLLADGLSKSTDYMQVRYVVVLLKAGRLDHAKAFLNKVQKTSLRKYLERVIETGVLPSSRYDHKARFVGYLENPRIVFRFRPSLLLFEALVQHYLRHGAEAQVQIAARVMKALPYPERQQALALWVPLTWRRGGFKRALNALRAIRYKSQRKRAAYFLVQILLKDGESKYAQRVYESMPNGDYKKKALLTMMMLQDLPVEDINHFPPRFRLERQLMQVEMDEDANWTKDIFDPHLGLRQVDVNQDQLFPENSLLERVVLLKFFWINQSGAQRYLLNLHFTEDLIKGLIKAVESHYTWGSLFRMLSRVSYRQDYVGAFLALATCYEARKIADHSWSRVEAPDSEPLNIESDCQLPTPLFTQVLESLNKWDPNQALNPSKPKKKGSVARPLSQTILS